MRRIAIASGILFSSMSSALAVACSDIDETPAVERRTENGVEIVVSHSPAWSPDQAWRLSVAPLLEIGNDESLGEKYVFSGVSGATRTPDGRIVVADRRAGELRFFNTEGTLVDVAGGLGQGPGEFSWIFDLIRCGEDRIHAIGPDVSISVFDLRGDFEQRFHPEQRAGFPIGYRFVCDRTGSLLATSRTPERIGTEGLYRTTEKLFLLDPDGGIVATLGSFPIQERLAGSGGSSPHPLGKQTSFALSGGRIYVGTADDYEIAVFNQAGRVVQRIRRATQPAMLDKATVTRYLQARLETVRPADRESMLSRFGEAEHPDAYPAYARLLVDERGYLWVQDFPPGPRSPTTWSVFDPAGAWLGDVQMPADFHALEIGEDYVLGRATGELNQESVSLYALEIGRP